MGGAAGAEARDGSQRLVAVMVHKGWAQLVAVLGVQLPQQRRAYLLKDGRVRVALSVAGMNAVESGSPEKVSWVRLPVSPEEVQRGSWCEGQSEEVAGEDTAYVILHLREHRSAQESADVARGGGEHDLGHQRALRGMASGIGSWVCPR